MKFSRKEYVEAFHYTSADQLEQFRKISYPETHIDSKGRLQFYYNRYRDNHIGVPLGFWLVCDGMWKTYRDEDFHKIYTCEEQETKLKYLKQTPSGCNPVYPERPYPNNIHSIKQALGLSNMALGKLCGLGYGIIANMDRGDRSVTDEYKELIEKATGYEVVRYYES